MAATCYWALIPAAGRGARMGAERPKQYLSLGECCVLEHTIHQFLSQDWISGVMVALDADDQDFSQLAVARDKRVLTTVGGATRADSVLAGLAAIAKLPGAQPQWQVLVHDAARPGVDANSLSRLRQLADPNNGGLLALPVADTLKRAQSGGQPAMVASTVSRDGLWQAQTPQMFPLGALRRALERALERDLRITDEASAMEAAGFSPRLVPGDPRNFKITWPADLAMARSLLGQGEAEEDS